MLYLLSPAKALDYETPVDPELPHTRPAFVEQSTALIEVLRKQSVRQVSRLMDLSEKLSELNVERYRQWSPRFTARNSRQAVLAFDGDVYGGLNARTMSRDELAWAQDHVRILSGLYGVLNPLDWMQPYRLEMGTALKTPLGKDLYAFWGPRISEHLNRAAARHATPVVINLASQEYFRSVDRKTLKLPVIDCVFEQWHGGKYKIISFLAKRARGLMARYAVVNRIDQAEGLQAFDLEGYAFAGGESTEQRLVFRQRKS